MVVSVPNDQPESDIFGQAISARSAAAVFGVELPQPVISALKSTSIKLTQTEDLIKDLRSEILRPPGIPVVGKERVYIDRVTGKQFSVDVDVLSTPSGVNYIRSKSATNTDGIYRIF